MEKELALQSKMMETYDAYQGSKAEEIRMKLDAEQSLIEQAQEMNFQYSSRMEQRMESVHQKIQNYKERQKEKNTRLLTKKLVAQEINDKRDFDSLNQHVSQQTRRNKQVTRLAKERNEQFKDKKGTFEEKLEKIKAYKREAKHKQLKLAEDMKEKD